jgi:hypothetical protein
MNVNTMKNKRFFTFICVFFIISVSISYGQDRRSIPEELLRPGWGESPRYPSDVVIGDLGQGRASSAAYSQANSIASALLSRQRGHPSFAALNPDLLDSYFFTLGRASPYTYRLGGGKEEADGAFSFLIRYIGRDFGVTGELYVRYITKQVQGEDGGTAQAGSWILDDLLLEEVKSRESEQREAVNRAEKRRLDYLPYERFY